MNNTKKLFGTLVSCLSEMRMKVRVVDIKRLPELREGIEAGSRRLLDQRFYWKHISPFDYELPDQMPGARVVLVVIAAQPALILTFTRSDREYRIMVPPIYHHATDRQADMRIKELLQAEGYGLAPAQLPEKILAVRSGLAEYGRNNLIYVEGMGSYHRPVVFFTDAPFEEESWKELRVAELCAKCNACLKKCPTGAISRKRFLLHAEKCLTYFNESERKFPKWLKPELHHCLIGCMRCQEECPLNRSHLKQVNGGTFSHEETEQILEGVKETELSPGIVEKLKRIDLLKDYKQVSRNLQALMEQHDHQAQEENTE
ncbi:MAG: epoxyqueuosine reductase [bacterium]|nr:epoxyqueuosine reductase [bacterium]